MLLLFPAQPLVPPLAVQEVGLFVVDQRTVVFPPEVRFWLSADKMTVGARVIELKLA